MSQPTFVPFTALDGSVVQVDSTDRISDLVDIPAALLPAGVAAGTYINFATGRVVKVQGSRYATASALGVNLGGFTAQLRANGAILNRSPYFTGWTLPVGLAGVYNLTPPAGVVLVPGSMGFIVTSETAALYGTASIVGNQIAVRIYDATGTLTNGTFDLLAMFGLT